MPKIEDLATKSTKKFEKSTYRPWNFIEQLEAEQIDKESIVYIDVTDIIRWKYKDRPENELGDITDLAETFKSVGQQQPCILRKSKEEPRKYELLVGERRWKAAEKAGLPLMAIIKEIDDKTATLIQAIENDKRKDISDFSKGMSYANKIENGIITQKDLIDILGISKQQISRLLSYSKIPQPLFDAIKDFRKVSSRTAEELVRLSRKSDEHLNTLIEMADKINSGEYGRLLIERELDKRLNGNDYEKEKQVIVSDEGKPLFTWHKDNGSLLISFPNEVTNLLKIETKKFNDITDNIKNFILNIIANDESPRGD